MRILYYDCTVGISGDMHLGALIDLGVDPTYLVNELSKLKLESEFELKVSKGSQLGITGTKVDVVLKGNHHHTNHDHNHHHHQDHIHDHTHDHAHNHTHEEAHDHHHRTFKTISHMIESSDLSDEVKTLSIKIFKEVAVAEAKVHGKSIDDVHFHEVGAVDSIVDIVGAAICILALKVDKIMASPVQLGGGFVKCAHGKIPVPAPATAEILKEVPVKLGLVMSETTTPTGAAILKATVEEYTSNFDFKIDKIGYGLGTKVFEVPNLTRVYISEGESDLDTAVEYIMETNIDDMNAEWFETIEQNLLVAGALDVYKTNIVMKKGRPAVKLSVLFNEKDRLALQRIIFEQTTSAGVREYAVNKFMLKRQFEKVTSSLGPVTLKHLYYGQDHIKSKLEYEDVKTIAYAHGMPLRKAYDILRREIDL